ncbi:MAG: calcium-binding protein [Gammaproteobacteria bacterium HGW-Gammaproteobacteria-13]|nr:MAG: calcium-binding protein [Gammaproteobacteria bacterium HGW-Gammaproteobacteria-13]
MKKLIIYALIAFVGWNYYQKHMASTHTEAQIENQTYHSPTVSITQPTQQFSCDGRQHCSQMRSRTEAEFFLRNCPNTKMDGDNDGIPCENDSRF